MPKATMKTEEQVNAEKEARVQEVKRLRLFVKDKLYPALLLATTSIDDAKFLLGSLSNMMMEQFLSQMRETKFIELQLHKKLDKESPNYKHFLNLLGLFSDESVYNARELVEGMKNELQMMIDNELKERKLETLKTNFLE